MASSQVEIAASAPFGCILRDHNRRDRCRDGNAFRKNLKDLVTSINVSPENAAEGAEKRPENSRNLKLAGGANHQNDVAEEPPSTLSPRQSRVLDRWATRQARDTMSRIEKQSHDAELAAAASDQSAPAVPSDQAVAPGTPNRGASSLVQIWEARLGQSHGTSRAATACSRSNSPLSCSNEEPSRKSEAGDSFEDGHEGSIGDWESERAVTEPPAPLSSSSSLSSTFSSLSLPRDPDPARESLKTPRVADIIRRLTSAGDENDNETFGNAAAGTESPSRDQQERCVVGSDHSSSEQRAFVVQMTNSPRLRGRQAFNDLLMHMERDRQREIDSLGERRVVSRFSQKGRIQSMLRLKVLQRGMGVHLQAQPPPRSSGSTERSSSSQSSSIVHLREKFTATTIKEAGTAPNDANTIPKTPQTQPINNLPGPFEDSSSCSSITVDQTIIRESHHSIVRESRHVEIHDVIEKESVPKQKEPAITEDLQSKMSVSSNVTYQETSFEAKRLELREQVVDSPEVREQTETVMSVNGCWYDEGAVEEEEEGQESNMEEEEEVMTSEGGYDWFLGVSRPRSYWEERRQAWYREKLETESENSDIRKLLERRRVSTFLTSDFRDRMNCLMSSHLQRQTHQMSEREDDMSNEERISSFLSSFLQSHSRAAGVQQEEQEEEPKEEKVEEVIREEYAEGAFQEEEEEDGISMTSQERRDQLMEEDEEEEEEEGIYLTGKRRTGQMVEPQTNAESVESQEEDGHMGFQEEEEEMDREEEDEEEGEDHNDRMVDMEEEEESPIAGGYHEAREYFNHSNPSSVTMPSPTFMRSWSYRSHEVNNNDHQPAASTSSREPLNSNPYYDDAWQPFNSIDRLSIEMELINELRGQMKQLYQEMLELRKSINSCMDMQVQLQDSFKEEIISARGERMKQQQGSPRKGHCCICYEKQVDSLLYRCGHMCTCLKCAQELQWKSGKCPICEAPIIDVVRAYRDS